MTKGLHEINVCTSALIEKCKAFVQFNRRPEGPLWRFLKACIVRQKNDNAGLFDLYDEYYKSNMLATSWSQTALAEILNCSRVSVSKQIKALEKAGYIKINKRIVYGKTYNVYILGTWVQDEDGKVSEKLFAETHFEKLALQERASNAKGKLMAV